MNPFELLMQFLQGGQAQAAPGPFADLKPGDRPLEMPGGPPAPPPPAPPQPPVTAPAMAAGAPQSPMIPPVQPPRFRAEEPGTLGSMLGGTLRNWGVPSAPSAEEYHYGVGQQKLQMEQGEREAMAAITPEIARIRESNPNAQPHEIMRQVMASPAFMQSAMKVPADKMQKFISGLVQETQKPAPAPFQLGNSYGTRDPVTGQVSIQGQVPTADMQNNAWLLALDPEKRTALMQIKQGLNKPSEKAAAINRLIQMGVIDQATGDKALAGFLFAQPDPESGITRRVDLTQGGIPGPVGSGAPQPGARQAQAQPFRPAIATTPEQAAAPQQSETEPMPIPQPVARPGQQPLPGQQAAPFDPAAPGGTYSSLLPNPADMVDETNTPGWLTGVVNKVGGQIDPSSVDPVKAAKRNAASHYATAVQNLKGTARRLKVEHELYSSLVDTPSLFGSNSMDAAVKGLQLREKVDQRMAQLQRELAGVRANGGIKGRAQKIGEELDSLRNFTSYTATADQWRQKIEQLKGGQGGPDWGGPIDAIPGVGKLGTVVEQGRAAETRREQRDAATRVPARTQTPQENPYAKLDGKGLQAEFQKVLQSRDPVARDALLAEIQRRKAIADGPQVPRGR